MLNPGKHIRNKYAALFAVCCLLVVVLVPLTRQLFTPDALCEATSGSPEKSGFEDQQEKAKCILFPQDEQPAFISLGAVEAVYTARLQSVLCEIFIPPPKSIQA